MFRYSLLLSIFFCTSLFASSPAGSKNVDSLFWRITTPDGKLESYLLGSIHLMEKKDFFTTDSFDACFNRSSVLITEVNMQDATAIAESFNKMLLPEGTTILNFITQKEFVKIDSIWRKLQFNELEIMSLKMMKPIFWTGMVAQKLMKQPHEGMDMYFTQKATADQKKIIGLEGIDFAIGQIDSIPLHEQYRSFLEGMNQVEEAKKEIQRMSRAYRMRQIGLLTQLIEEGFGEMQGSEKHLLQERNNYWMSTLHESLTGQSCFVVVGAAHLFGNAGLLRMLRDKGYQIQPFPRHF